MIDALDAAIKEAGTQKAFALKHGISIAYVNDVVHGRKEPGQKILTALGLKRVITYEPLKAKRKS